MKDVALVMREVARVAPLPEPLPSGPHSKDQEKILRLERTRAALAMRRKGMSYDDIAAQLRVGVPTVRALIHRGIRTLMNHDREDVEVIRRLEIDRLDMMLVPLMEDILNKRTPPDVRNAAIDRVLKLQDRRAKLCGLDREAGAGTVERAVIDARVALLPAIRGATKEDLVELRAVLVRSRTRALENKGAADDGGRTEEPDPVAAG